MTIWVIVFHFATISGVPIMPLERPQGFVLQKDCMARIPEMRRRWDALKLPPLVTASCEVLEMRDK